VVLDGIRRNAPFLFTHNMAAVIQARCKALLASLPDEPVNQERLAADLQAREFMKLRLSGKGPRSP